MRDSHAYSPCIFLKLATYAGRLLLYVQDFPFEMSDITLLISIFDLN